MSETSMTIELIGGPADGRLFIVDWEFLNRPLRVPLVPSLSEMVGGYDRPGQACLWEEESVVLLYEWDSTVREDGVRRFRLRRT